jgi:salicylate hydroxylase
MSVSEKKLRILVVGGGVAGGLVAGWLVSRPGVEVTCLERVSADDHANAGNGLNIGPNGLAVLASAFPEKEAELRAASLPWETWLARRADGSIAYHIPLAEVSKTPGIRIRWSELYRLSRSSALPVLRFETETESVTSKGNEVEVGIRDRHGNVDTERFDLVVVAEGRYSKIREQLAGAPEPRQLGIANFRTLISDNGSIDLDDMEQWFTGPHRIIATRLHDGLIYISGNLPLVRGAEIPEEMKDKAYLRNAYTPSRGICDARLSAVIEHFCHPDSVHHWARAQQIDTRWSDLDGRVLYIGDAAHAMAPTLGQGATQAIEDAAAWIRLYTMWVEDGGARETVPLLSKAYARLRTERVEFVRDFSASASDVLLLDSDTEAALAKKRSSAYRENLQRLYGEIPLDTSLYQSALDSCYKERSKPQ